MGLVLRYVVTTKAGTKHYRRRLPKDVAEAIGKGEFKRLLGSTEREALRKYPTVNAEFERLVEGTRRQIGRRSNPTTPLDVHREAERRARELASEVVHIGGRRLVAGEHPEAAELLRDSYIERMGEDGGDAIEGRALGILISGGELERPSPTVEDARLLYIKERIKGDINETAKASRLNRVMDHLSAASVGKDRTLESLTREDARNVRDYLLRDLNMNPATVRRYLNDARAVISLGITELGVRDMVNPFLNLPIRLETTAVAERSPIPDTLLSIVRNHIEAHAGAELWQIWRIVEGTGCRLGEVTGLLASDLHLNHAIPHISLVPHPHRRLKTAGSVRLVPLVGEALTAAREAMKAVEDEDGQGAGRPLFPRYGRLRGADAVSAILMKHIRAVTNDPKIVVHSLRHRMEDRLTIAGVNEFDRNLILGHSRGGMSERYGGPDARLKVAERALRKALAKGKG